MNLNLSNIKIFNYWYFMELNTDSSVGTSQVRILFQD